MEPLATQPLFDRHVAYEGARVVCIPAAFEGTVSYRCGTVDGPASISVASHQLDFAGVSASEDPMAGSPSLEVAGQRTAMLVEDPWIRDASAETRAAVESERIGEANRLCDAVQARLGGYVSRVLDDRNTPVLVGGEHAVSLAGIVGCSRRVAASGDGFGVLQFDAHMDLRAAYQGLEHSHASVMRNALGKCENLTRLVQVGVRDFCEEERAIAAADPRIGLLTGWDLGRARMGAHPCTMAELLEHGIEMLPRKVYVTIDIDGLDPSLCLHTGTPVPGGLRFEELVYALRLLVRSGREIIGGDVVEVAPGDGDPSESYDACVGARVLSHLCQAILDSSG